MESTFDTGLGSSGRKSTILVIIVIFHIGLIWALAASLSRIDAERAPTIIQADIIEEVTKEEELPPPPPALETPPPYVPPPDFVVENLAPAPSTTALVTTVNKPTPTAPVVVKKAVKTAPVIDPRYRSRFQPAFPPTSRRLGEEGSVIISVLVGVDGKVQDAKIQTSSGYPRLDEAALKHALRAWRFTPGTEDGKPEAVWNSIKVTFKIEG